MAFECPDCYEIACKCDFSAEEIQNLRIDLMTGGQISKHSLQVLLSMAERFAKKEACRA